MCVCVPVSLCPPHVSVCLSVGCRCLSSLLDNLLPLQVQTVWENSLPLWHFRVEKANIVEVLWRRPILFLRPMIEEPLQEHSLVPETSASETSCLVQLVSGVSLRLSDSQTLSPSLPLYLSFSMWVYISMYICICRSALKVNSLGLKAREGRDRLNYPDSDRQTDCNFSPT